jgi:hypothetical protein
MAIHINGKHNSCDRSRTSQRFFNKFFENFSVNLLFSWLVLVGLYRAEWTSIFLNKLQGHLPSIYLWKDTQMEFFLVYQPISVYNHILTNHFWCEFLVYIWITLFSSLLFFQQAGSMPGDALWAGKVNEIMPGCHPSYLKTVSQQVVCWIRTHFLRFLTPNTAVLVRIIQIHTTILVG